MKNLFTAIILGIALGGVSFAQGPAGGATAPKLAVVEFSVERNAEAMTDQAKRDLQTVLSALLNHTRRFDVYDTRHTRNASQADLAAINGASTAVAVKVGKQLPVAYVLTGTVVDYDNKIGKTTIKARLIEVATGKVKYSGEIVADTTMKMTAGAGAVEMHSKVIKPAIEKLTESVAAAL